MRSNAYIRVTCDECGDEVEIELTGLSRGSYDERNVEPVLDGWNWQVIDGKDFCAECVLNRHMDDDEEWE